MTKNVGNIDRLMRIALGIVLVLIPIMSGFSTWTTIAGIIGVIAIATAGMRFCPLYRILGIQTCKM